MNANIAKKTLKTLICIATVGAILISAACAAKPRVALQDESSYISVDETDVSVLSYTSDAFDVYDASNAYDFFDAFDVTDASNTYDFFDAFDVSDVSNVYDVSDAPDITPDVSDVSDVHYATAEHQQSAEQHIEQRIEPRPEDLQAQIEELQQARAELERQAEEVQTQIDQLQQIKVELELQAAQQERQQIVMRQRFQPQVDLLTRQLAECRGDRCALLSYQLGTLYYTAAIQNGGQDFSMVKQQLQQFLNEYPDSPYAPYAIQLLARIE